MTIPSQQLWPHIRDAFGISPDLKVYDFVLKLPLNSEAEISLQIFAGYDPASGQLEKIQRKFKLGDAGVPKEQAEALYWSGISAGFKAGKDPLWMHPAHLIAFEAKQEIQDMANKFNNRLQAA